MLKTIVIKSLFYSAFALFAFYLLRSLFQTQNFVSDIGGINNFFALFGTLYGILTAFVIFEVWNEYNATVQLIEKECLALEQFNNFILYFRDDKFAEKIKKAISSYVNEVIKDEFPKFAKGKGSDASSQSFRKLFLLIKDVKFNDDHDSMVFGQVIGHYKTLSEIRSERINQSLTRLPSLLKFFLYLSSFLAISVFLLMPFVNVFYGFLTIGILTFILGMVFQLIEDLDNPFEGYWNISREPFERTMRQIKEGY